MKEREKPSEQQLIIDQLFAGHYRDPFAFLGMHQQGKVTYFRVLLPNAQEVTVLDRLTAAPVVQLSRLDERGFFSGDATDLDANFTYILQVNWGNSQQVIEDPYRFGTLLHDADTKGLQRTFSFETLGAHVRQVGDITGTHFCVWAPNAQRVSVVGAFNFWDGRRYPMRHHPENGLWEIFLPAIQAGTHYQYEILDAKGEIQLKSDPYAFRSQLRPDTTSIVSLLPKQRHPTAQQIQSNQRNAPISIYEVHLGSWRRSANNHSWLTYRELAETLLPYVKEMGFTHLEILPISEHPFDGSWGYQPLGIYSPTSRFGSPQDLIDFVDEAHRLGINVILDWVPGHFPSDNSGLANFDGTPLYEYADPKEGKHRDWDTLIYDYRSHEVRQFLSDNAVYWVDRFGFDGLRVDAVASMIYRDYSRPDGEWIANEYGGNINLEAVSFLQHTNELLHRIQPNVLMAAEESTDFSGVTLPPSLGGLGFNYKWNMGWMHDTLSYLQLDPIARKYHHNKMTFSVMYAWSENYILPLSHDEVVHGKGSLLRKMSGSPDQKFATLRAYYGFMWAHPGKKLLFMGGEIAQWREWDHDGELDWHLVDIPTSPHAGVQRLIRDLNVTYRSTPALYDNDHNESSFEWVIVDDHDNSVFAFIRYAENGDPLLVISHFTPVTRADYRIGVRLHGQYQVLLNTNDSRYGGSDKHPVAPISSQPIKAHGCQYSIALTLPPLSTLYLTIKPATKKNKE
ncbi:TPA: 1,4-alpha-glucan branching protein GlgB [Providencia stuartii]|uniref:1,4-alpha-glucan branching enzyme GlgB n=2 Tax=Providencia stuartii TaxID=588 RepID=A0AA87CV20_PROST|nr:MULTISPECIES: 1,4-alpha-glucan branching protein GlgB [Providencia]SST03995.1 1,4-alpha-glucan branching enzyme GlgB [Acinetobacter baumannii]EDU61650.1 1,4-alpha-glucan branching enzyme [Providencia stuartii ATCC 25827]KNZ86091.1 glycogen branching protein [Providencia stuartii]KSX93027.1 glycogen-branching enzyme [Providencia stuartii]MBN5559106.1 1,4-alpha-glucan branching protein GlgB [Providencia stuartii]